MFWIAVIATLRSADGAHQVALATAHPTKFAKAVKVALLEEKGAWYKDALPTQFVCLKERPRRVRCLPRNEGREGSRKSIVHKMDKE